MAVVFVIEKVSLSEKNVFI